MNLRENTAKLSSSAKLPSTFGSFIAQTFEIEGETHFALIKGNIFEAESVFVRIHSECLTGDVFGSKRCDCRQQLEKSLALIEKKEKGVFIYLRGHEGRGIGLGKKICAYELQDDGYDTVEANLHLGLPVDNRKFGAAAQILFDLGITSIVLMTNNLNKYKALVEAGINIIERISLNPQACVENHNYLKTKQSKMGHLFEIDEDKIACGLKS